MLPGVAQQALQYLGEALLVSVVLEAALVGEVGVPWVGVQRVELIHVVVGPAQEVDSLALQIGGEGA